MYPYIVRIVLGLALAQGLFAQGPALAELRPVFLSQAPVLRGDLSDPAWAKAKLPAGQMLTYNPVRGNSMPLATEIYMAYDATHLYVGFHCFDNQPELIKASLAKRDDMFSDDWVGLSLDAFGSQHNALHLFVNPLGIQGDALDSVPGGEDFSPDWVWESHAQRQADGYTVEICIPLKSIRFKSGQEVRMGVLFWRRISRLGISGSWPAMAQGQWVYRSHAPLLFQRLDAPLRLEVLPSVTYSRNEEQVQPGQWNRDTKTSAGIGLKLGLSSTITADLTYKPDFSQVESDAFQVQVNQRYPSFHSEKRPFFMESMGIFNLAGTGGDLNMQVPVHTRRIVDPLWGAKLTGDTGPNSFGVLASGDRSTGQPWADGLNPDLGRRAEFTIGRAMYGFGKGSYVGAIYTGRDFNGSTNRVGGVDFSYLLSDRHSFAGNLLQTASTNPGDPAAKRGFGSLLAYNYSTKPLDLMFTSEHYGADFRMDTAYFNRTGIDQQTFYIGPNFYPKIAWIHKVNPFLFGKVIKDNVTGLTDVMAVLALRINTTRSGSFRGEVQQVREGWKGQLFDQTAYKLSGSALVSKWLNLGAQVRLGDDLNYDAPVPFKGRTVSYGFNATLQPSDQLRFYLDVFRTGMKDPITGTQVYDVKTTNAQLTYQFNSYFFLRSTARIDTFQRRMLTDYLASFTFIPGTVMFLGYGEVFQKTQWQEDRWVNRGDRYEPSNRGLFCKLSYLWRN